MRRRDFLVGSLAALTNIYALPKMALAVGSPLPSKIIDVHCHIFNARDIPMVDFVEKAFVNTHPEIKRQVGPYEDLLDFVLHDLAKWLRTKAFTAKTEIKQIDDNKTREIADEDIKALTELIEKWRWEGKAILRSGLKIDKKLIGFYLPTTVIGFLHREVSPGTFDGPQQFTFGNALDNSDDAFTREKWFDSDFLAAEAYKQLPGPMSRAIIWGLLFSRYRFELADELHHKIHGKRTVLLVPALVDFAKWLDASDPTSIAEQVDVMARISRRSASPERARVHGFVPFDPLRQAIHDKLGRPTSEAPLATVQNAVEKSGFIGVKLYPPMGFRPSNNVGAGDDFPCFVRYGKGSPGYAPKCIDAKNTPDGLGKDPGMLIDQALETLFAWCDQRGVPIMAHTNNSNAAGPGYGTRADPKYWEPVMKSHQKLRINLAHFGSFSGAFVNDKFHQDLLPMTWEWEIGKLIESSNGRIFADLSYFSEALGADRKEQILICMSEFKKAFLTSGKALMYGSDWTMIGKESTFPVPFAAAQYPEIVAEFLAKTDYKDDLNDIFFGNAVRFLGLAENIGSDSTRTRLQIFYGGGEKADWLKQFG
jgi:predicted TIM-barrel fold metal-dependent hydrolase